MSSHNTPEKAAHGQHGELTADDSRGAGAITNAASVRVLNRMSAEEAQLPKISVEERRLYLRVSRDKANFMPATKATWFQLVSIGLPNGDDIPPGDQVQAIEAWDYPQPFDNVTTDDMRWARDAARQGSYRHDPRSHEWFGYPLARRLESRSRCGPQEAQRHPAYLARQRRPRARDPQGRRYAMSGNTSYPVTGTRSPMPTELGA